MGDHLGGELVLGDEVHDRLRPSSGNGDVDVADRLRMPSQASAVRHVGYALQFCERVDQPFGDRHRIGDRGSLILPMETESVDRLGDLLFARLAESWQLTEPLRCDGGLELLEILDPELAPHQLERLRSDPGDLGEPDEVGRIRLTQVLEFVDGPG